MRSREILSLVALSCCGSLGWGQSPETAYWAVVRSAEAEVRSGPSDKPEMYATERLPRGERVRVVRTLEGGWLAIEPPAGAFSWVNERHVVQKNAVHWAVSVLEGAPILVGSRLVERKPSVISVRAARGTWLKSWGKRMVAEDGAWLQIVPPPQEVRFIRAQDVAREGTDATVAKADATITPRAPSPPQVDTLAQARLAESQRRLPEAILLYRQASQELTNSNHEQSLAAANRAQFLEDALRGVSGPVPFPQPAETRQANRPAASPAQPTNSWEGSLPGRLVRSDHPIEGQPAYLLLDPRGLPIVYAVARPGYSLDPYLNENLVLRGMREWRPELRAYRMVVMEVQRLR